MKICFIISSLSHGGAERVCSLLVNEWSQRGHDVNLLTYENKESVPFYKINKNVNYQKLDLLKNSSNIFSFILINIKRILIFKKFIKKTSPDICVSFMAETNVLAVISARLAKVPIVISERIHPVHHEIGWLRKFARNLIYPYANHLVVQSKEIENWFEKNIEIKSSIIPNPIYLNDFKTQKKIIKRPKVIVSIGRLVWQKGFDLLIEAFARTIRDYPDWKLEIYGEGEERDNLTTLINNYNIENSVSLKGVTNDIASVLHRAEIFVLASRYEGYPNVLIEALAAGCCTIATNSPGAVSDILNNGEFGMLLEDTSVNAITYGMNELMSSQQKRDMFRDKAPYVVNALDVNLISEKWLDLFELLVPQKVD